VTNPILHKSLKSEEEEKAFVQSKASDEKVHSKKDGKLKNNRSLGSMTVEQIQNLIASAVKAQLRGDACKTHFYTKPTTERVKALCMPGNYHTPKF